MDYKHQQKEVEIGKFHGFDHCVFYVGNAYQAASFYTTRFGFEFYAYQGLETGSRDVASHVVKKNDIIFVFQSSYDSEDKNKIGEFLAKHGDAVRDVAFTVEDCKKTFEVAKKRGAEVIQEPQVLEDENGKVIIAKIKAYYDTIHTLVERKNFKGTFMPGFKAHPIKEVFNTKDNEVHLDFIDHIVGNMPEHEMEPTASWYEKTLDFHRFWSVDDKILHTDYSALNSIVMADNDEVIKLPINEPAKGKKKSQIQEYVDYYAGGGVQHIALNTQDIINSIQKLKNRGVQFLEIPKAYYDNLRMRLEKSKVEVKEDLDILEKLQILVDFDDKGYLCQIFTKPLEDRPLLFIEIIQRRNHQGFGAGNFKSLFKAIEDEQDRRGNLTDL